MTATRTLCAALFACLAFQAQASVITLQIAGTNAGSQGSADAYRSAVNAAMGNASAYKGSKSVSVYDNLQVKNYFGSISNYAFESTINFGVTAAQAGAWNFRTGVDLGFGGALFVDGIALSFDSHDMWWNNSYSTAHGSLSGSLNLAAGNHVLTVYGLESCCDGGQQAQFKAANSQAFTTFAAADGLNNVPEPASIATIVLGLGALAYARRRRQQG